MPQARSDMRRIREVLRLRDEFGASQRQIADACRLPWSTVRNYLERLRASGLRYEDNFPRSEPSIKRLTRDVLYRLKE